MRSQKFLRQKLSVLTSNTDKKEFKNLLAHKIKRHPFAGQFGVKAEVIRQFLYAKVSLLNDPSEVAENTVIIDGYVDDLTSENYKASLPGELHSKCEFFYKKDYIYFRPKLCSVTKTGFHEALLCVTCNGVLKYNCGATVV